MTHRLLVFLIACFIGTGCQDKTTMAILEPVNDTQNEQKVKPMAQEVIIKIGEQAVDFRKRYPDRVNVQQQPAGLDFYSIDWDSYPRGTVKIDHGKHSVVIDGVLGIQTHTNIDLPKEGFYSYTIFAGLSNSPPGLISHDEARLKTYALLKKVEQAGWQTLISEDDPRITGKDRLDRALTVTSSIGLDTKYIPTLGEWMRIENLTSWNFYADHQYLSVYFKREHTLLDPAKPGSYLLTYALKSEAENYRGYVGPASRARWKELLPGELAKLKNSRFLAEVTLKAQGVAIDESYQDPPVPALK
jgi:hypothetical protein